MSPHFYATAARPSREHVGKVWSVWICWRPEENDWARRVWLLRGSMTGTDAIDMAERINRDRPINDEQVQSRMLSAMLEVEFA